jgi:hypothetical protein
MPPPSPNKALASRLSELAAFHLEIVCGCGARAGGGRLVRYPIALMIARHGRIGELRLAQIIERLRCECCGKRPSSVSLLETNLRSGQGRTRGWSIALPGASARQIGERHANGEEGGQEESSPKRLG